MTWYAHYELQKSKQIACTKLAAFQRVADTYTKNGTPSELKHLICELEGIMDELQVLVDTGQASRCPLNRPEISC